MKKDFNQSPKSGFAPLLVIIVMVVVLSAGVGGYVFVAKEKKTAPPEKSEISKELPQETPEPQKVPAETETAPAPPPASQTQKTETSPLPTAVNPTELLGWWEEEGGFPFLKEFTDTYFCVQYSSRSTCVDNVRYRVEGNKIFAELEWLSGHPYATWKMIGDKLELTSADSPSKTLYKKISEPTSPDRELPGSLQANLELIKASKSGICLRHNGGDIVSVSDIELTVDGKTIPISTFGQFPKFEDFLFSAGEALVLPGTFNAGSKVSIKLARNIIGVAPSFAITESGSWTIERLVVEPFPNSVSAPFWYGFASCP